MEIEEQEKVEETRFAYANMEFVAWIGGCAIGHTRNPTPLGVSKGRLPLNGISLETK